MLPRLEQSWTISKWTLMNQWWNLLQKWIQPLPNFENSFQEVKSLTFRLMQLTGTMWRDPWQCNLAHSLAIPQVFLHCWTSQSNHAACCCYGHHQEDCHKCIRENQPCKGLNGLTYWPKQTQSPVGEGDEQQETQGAVGEMYTGDLATGHSFLGFSIKGIVTSLNYAPMTFFSKILSLCSMLLLLINSSTKKIMFLNGKYFKTICNHKSAFLLRFLHNMMRIVLLPWLAQHIRYIIYLEKFWI